jgi:hypothetical protein
MQEAARLRELLHLSTTTNHESNREFSTLRPSFADANTQLATLRFELDAATAAKAEISALATLSVQRSFVKDRLLDPASS